MNPKHDPASSNRPGGLWSRLLPTVRVGWGLLLLTAPAVPAAVLDPDGTLPPVMRPVLRVLGARHVVQGVLTAARPTPAVLALGAGADALHAASALAYGAVRPGSRRPARADAAVASLAATAWTLWAARSARGATPG